MQVGNFIVGIMGKNSKGEYEQRPDVDGYVRMAHGQKFKVRLENHGDRRCAVPLYINGVHQGTFVLGPRHRPRGYYQYSWGSNSWFTEIERSVDGDGQFTAYARGSAEGHASGAASTSEQDGGVISVTFQPELLPSYQAEPKPQILGRASGQGSGGWGGQSVGSGGAEAASPYEEVLEGLDTLSAESASPESWSGTATMDYMPSYSTSIGARRQKGPLVGGAVNNLQATDVAAMIGQSGISDQKFTVVADFAKDGSAQVGPLELRLVIKAAGPRPLPGTRKAPPPVKVQ